MKRTAVIILALLILCGCSTPEVTDEDVTVDLTSDFDIDSILSNVKEGSNVSYQLDKENSKLIITIEYGDKTETLEKEVTIEEPQYSIKDDISFNPYLDYDINDFITVEDGVSIDYSLDIKSSTLTFNLSKGNWSKSIDKQVTLESLFDFSNVGSYGALIYIMKDYANRPEIFNKAIFNKCPGYGLLDVLVLAEDHTGFYIRYHHFSNPQVSTTLTWTDDGVITFDKVLYMAGVHYPYLGGDDLQRRTLTILEDGTIKTVLSESRNEYITFEKVDSFSPPMNAKNWIESWGSTVSATYSTWGFPKMIENWYEAGFSSYSTDYNGISVYQESGMYDK